MAKRDDRTGDLFAPGAIGKAEGMARVAEHAEPGFMAVANAALRSSALAMPYLTSNDVWDRIPAGIETHENRAMGPIMQEGARAGWIVATKDYVKTRRPSRNQAPVMIWRSLLFKP